MILDESFKYFSYWDAIELGLYFIVVGYYFLIFAYFILMRYRTTKKLYWLFFSLVFIFLAAGRLFFIGLYFFIPEANMSDAAMAATLMLYYRLATFFTWMGIAMLCGVLGILLFPPEAQTEELTKTMAAEAEKIAPSNKKINLTAQHKLFLRILLFVVPILIGCFALFMFPNELIMTKEIKDEYDVSIDIVYTGALEYPIGRTLLNFVFLPLLVIIIPFLFFYLGLKTFGVLRQSYWLNCIGFILYFAGRITQGLFNFIGWVHFAAVMSPLLIIASLLIIVIANNYEQLK